MTRVGVTSGQRFNPDQMLHQATGSIPLSTHPQVTQPVNQNLKQKRKLQAKAKFPKAAGDARGGKQMFVLLVLSGIKHTMRAEAGIKQTTKLGVLRTEAKKVARDR